MKTEGLAPVGVERLPMRPRRLEQHEGANDIALNEVAWTVDGPIDVTLRSQMHHGIGVVRRKDRGHSRRIGDVGAHQDMAVVPSCFLQCILGGRVGHLVDVYDDVVGLAQHVADHRGADEPTAPVSKTFIIRSIPSVALLHECPPCADYTAPANTEMPNLTDGAAAQCLPNKKTPVTLASAPEFWLGVTSPR